MFKKVLFSILLCLIVIFAVGSEEIYFYAKESGGVFKGESSLIGTLKPGERYKFLKPYRVSWYNSNMRIQIEYGSWEGWVDPGLLYNKGSDSFSDEILNDNNNQCYGWMQSYYLDVIKSGQRDKLYEFEPYWRDDYLGYEGRTEWWEDDFSPLNFRFNNVYINVWNQLDFYVKKITKKGNSYYLEVKLLDNFLNEYKFNFKPVAEKDYFTMIIKHDGDFLTIYLENESNKLAELVKGNRSLYDALYKTVRKEKVELSEVKWPMREAEKQAHELAFKRSFLTITTPKLRFYSTPAIKGETIRLLLSGEKLKFIEYGKSDTIAGKDGRWVKIKTEKGEVGWCFETYLKVLPQADTTTTKASKKNYYTPTVDNLRFRATPTLDGRFIRHLSAGERLELIEKGKTETIGDAKGTWVKVKTMQGEVGWCFDAYLKELK